MENLAQYYAALNIDSAASLETVKHAYRQLVKTWHPDKYVDNPKLTSQAEVEIKKINQAYSAIKSYLELQNNIPGEVANLRSQVSFKKNTPDFYYSQGVEYAEKGDYRDALVSFSQATKLDPDCIKAYQYRGFILSKLGYEYRAAAEFEQVARIKTKKKKKTLEDDRSTQTNTSSRNRAAAEFEQVARIKTKKKKKTSEDDSSTQTNTSSRSSVKKQAIKCSRTIVGINQPVTSIAIGFDNSLFACVRSAREIELRDISTGQIVGTLRGHTNLVNSLIIDSEGTTLISGGKDKAIRFWDLKARKIVKTFGGYFDGHSKAILSLAVSPDNTVLLSYGADNIINAWDIKHARIIRSISVSADLNCLQISPNCELFCTSSLESQFEIRKIADGKVIRSINNNSSVLCMAFSPDSNILATGGVDCLVRLWDIRTGNIIHTLEGHCQGLSNLAFTSNSKNLIGIDSNGVIKIWKLQTGKEITSIEAHSSKIQAVAIASNRQTLISGDDEGKIKVWDCFLGSVAKT